MSNKVTLYEGIVAELENLPYTKADNSTGNLRTVKLWRKQPFKQDKTNPVLYPACFIEFLPSNHMESSSKVYQSVDMLVRLHVCFEAYEDEDLDVLRLMDAIYSALQLKQWGFWGLMKRRNEETDFDQDNIHVFTMDFDAGKGKDYGADKRPTTDATIDTITINIDKVDQLSE